MNRNYVEVVVKAEIETGEFLGILDNTEFSGSWEEDGVSHFYWPENTWSDAVLADIHRALKVLGINTGEENPAVNVVENQDWNTTWAASLEPIRLGRRIRIRQSWHSVDPGFDGIELVLDPMRAFGTGYHATTQMVMEWLEDNIEGGERLLDIGTGSGILSMLALRLGALSALAVDIDETALECAKEYAAMNAFGPELEFRIASFEEMDSFGYDVILANIDGRTLPSLCPHLPRFLKANGIACFSGMQYQDYEEIENALGKVGFWISAHRQRGEWMALELKRKT